MKDKRALAAGGVVLAALLFGWFIMSSSDDQGGFSASGFDLRGAASIAARAAAPSDNVAPREPASSLVPIRRASEELAPPAKPQPPPQQSADARPAAAAAEAKADGQIPEASASEAAGFGLTLGALKAGAFKFAWKITDYPRVLKFLLNNKAFNDAVFSQKFAQKICNDSGFARAYMSDPKAAGGVQDEMWAVNELLKKPESAKAAAQSQFADRIMNCNGFQGIVHDKQAVAGIAAANPGTLMVLSNPTALEIIGENTKAQDALLQIQAGLNDGPPPAAASTR